MHSVIFCIEEHAYVCMYAFMYVCVKGFSAFYVFYYISTPHYAYDCIFYSTVAGRKFLHYCDVVHKFSDDIIMQRREELLQVYNMIGDQILSGLLNRKQNQLESTKTF